MTILLLLILGFATFAATYFYQRSAARRLVKVIVAGTSLTVGIAVAFLLAPDPTYLGAEELFSSSPLREVVFLLLMLGGMSFRYLTGAIEERRELVAEARRQGRDPTTIPLHFDKWEFAYPLLFSALTFAGLLPQLGDGMTVANCVLSFQTGFLWQTLLKQKLPAVAADSSR